MYTRQQEPTRDCTRPGKPFKVFFFSPAGTLQIAHTHLLFLFLSSKLKANGKRETKEKIKNLPDG